MNKNKETIEQLASLAPWLVQDINQSDMHSPVYAFNGVPFGMAYCDIDKEITDWIISRGWFITNYIRPGRRLIEIQLWDNGSMKGTSWCAPYYDDMEDEVIACDETHALLLCSLKVIEHELENK